MATRTINTKLALDGETEYKAKLKNINAELSLHKSELEKVQAQYKGSANTLEALSAKQSALKGQMDALNERHKEQADMLEKAVKAQQKFASEAENLRTKLEALKNSSEDTAEEEEKLTEELANTEASMQKAANSVTYYQKELNRTETSQSKLSTELDKTGQYMEEAAHSTDGCAKSIDKYGNEVKDAGEDSKKFGDTSKEAINQLASALAAAGIAKSVEEIAAALKDCVDTFASFQSQMSTVQAISGASAFQMQELADKAKYMGATTSFTATEAGQALEYMAMAGWKSNDMLGGLEGVMHLAAASGEDLASVSDIVTDALTAFGLAASDSARFADVLAAASSNSNTNVAMMGETFKYAAPVAGALGYSIEDTALAIGLMANAGIKGSQAGTALRGTLTNLTKPSKENAAYMDKLGISLTDASGNVRSLSELMDILRERFAGLTEAEQAEYAAGIAGKEAMSGLLAIVNASEADYQKLTAAINTCSGSAKEMSEIRLDNLSGQVTLLESAVDGFKLAIGESLAPVLTDLAKVGTTAFAWASDFVSKNPWLVQAIAGAIGAFGLLTAGISAYMVVTTAAKAVQDALNLSMGLCPLVAVTVAAGALVGVIGSCVASLDDADEKTKSFTDSLQDSKTAYEDMTATMAEQQASTKAVANSLLDLLLVEEKSALQKDLIAQKVDQLNEAVPGLGLAYDREKDALVGLTEAELESMLTRAAAQEEYEAQVARLNELTSQQAEIEARLTEARLALNEAQQTGSGNTQELQNNIDALTIAQAQNAAQITALEEASRAYGEQQAENTLKTETMTAKIEELEAQLADLEEAYLESWAAARESIEGQVGLFSDLDISANTSINDMIDSMKGQVEYMETYAANIQKAMEMGVDLGLVQKLSDGSKESAQILDTIVKGGEEDIKALNEEFAKVEEGKNQFATTVADMETDFSRQMDRISQDLSDAMKEMEQYDEARKIGENNVRGLINGSSNPALRQRLVNQYAQMGRDALAAYKRAVGQASPSKKFHEVGRYDIQGIIGGAEAEKPRLAAAYEQAARAALTSMERHLPSTIVEPNAAAAQDRQTRAIVAAVSVRDSAGTSNPIYIDKLVVRDESDVHRIAQELYYMTQRERRSRGGGSL